MTFHPAPARRRDAAPRLGPLLAGTAVLALAMGAGVARGQTFIGNGVAFQGNATTALGSVTLANTANTDTLTVHSATAIIDWTPYAGRAGSGTSASGAPLVFLPQGSTGVFQNGTEVSNFTVLNRINAASGQPIEFDGHVVSQLVGATGAVSRGGNVWFYAPGGIIVGSTGVFDVGSLILTTGAINTAGDTVLPTPTGGLSFTSAGGSTAAVSIQPGAQINQPVAGSYLAVVAPRIAQGGTVTINGSAGYIAAQAADVTINAGLFDITGTIGSTVAAGGETTLTHSGTTTGPAATDVAAPHRVYLVAVPQNDAVTMLVGGTIGYQAATDATVENGEIVLGAGYVPGGTATDPTFAATGGTGNITVSGATFTSALTAEASGNTEFSTVGGNIAATSIFAENDGNLDFHVTADQTFSATGDVTLSSYRRDASASLTMAIDAGGTAIVGGSLQGVRRGADAQGLTFTVAGTLQAGAIGLTTGRFTAAGDATAGTTTLLVDGGNVTVSGGTYVASLAEAGTNTLGLSGNSTGGTAQIEVTNDGRASFGIVNVVAGTSTDDDINGTGNGLHATLTGGVQQGGTASILATSGGSISASGAVIVTSTAEAISDATNAGRAIGGTASIVADGGTIQLAGGDGSRVSANATGGNAQGGGTVVSAVNGGQIAITGDFTLTSVGTNGSNASLAAHGGTAAVTASGGTLSVGGATVVDARGVDTSVSGAAAAAPAGNDAIGGSATITVGAPGNTLASNATFGGGVAMLGGAVAAQSAGATGSATGGQAIVAADGGAILGFGTGLTVDTTAAANANGVDPGIVSTGGESKITAIGGAISLTGFVEISADARGGTATGGNASLLAGGGGSITSGSLDLEADGAGGSLLDGSIAGYAGAGGSASIAASDGSMRLTSVDLRASGNGGSSTLAEGGAGAGGTASIATTDPAGEISIGFADLGANGTAGAGLTGAANGRGGTSSITATGGSISFTSEDDDESDSISAIADGLGSTALTAGRDPETAGIGYGGTVRMIADEGGSISVADNAYLSPYATGGDAGVSGIGGTAIGGTVTLAALDSTGEPGSIHFGSMDIDTGSFGGFGATGGAAIAGTSTITIGQGAIIGGATLSGQTYAYGGGAASGSSGAGGAATGGSTTLTIDGGTLNITGNTDEIPLVLTASAIGGGGGGLGGTGGDATGSAVSITVNSGALDAIALEASALTAGGAGGTGAGTIGGNGGAATGGTATFTMAGGTVDTPGFFVGTTVLGGTGGAGAGFTDDPNAPTPVQSGFAGGNGGAASGGTASVAVSGGALSSAELSVYAATTGGDGGAGGDGSGSDATGPALGGVGGAGGTAAPNSATLSVTGGSVVTASTFGTAITNGGAGGAGGNGGTYPASGTRTQAATGTAGDARGGALTIETDLTGTASLGATMLTAGGTVGDTIEAGTITLAAADSEGTAPATPLTLDSLTATMNANLTTTGDYVRIAAAAPIAISGDASISGFVLTRFDMSGRGTLGVGGALTNDTLEVIGTQTDPTAGTIAITAGSATIDASFGGVTLATLTTTSGDLSISGASVLAATDLVSAGNATLSSGGSVGFANLTAAQDIDIEAGGALSGATLTSTHGEIDAEAAGASAITTVSAGGEVEIVADGSAEYGSVTAGTDPTSAENDGGSDFGSVALVSQEGNLTIDTGVTAYQSIGLVAGGTLSAPSLVAANGGSVGVLAGGAITLGTVTAPNLFYVGGLGAIDGLDPDASASEIVAALQASGPVASGGGIAITGAQAGTATIDAGTTLGITGTLATTGDAAIDATGAINEGTLAIGGSLVQIGQSTTTIGTATAGTDLSILSRDDLSVSTATAGRDAVIFTFIASDDTDLLSRGVNVGSVTAGDDAIVTAWGTLNAGTITATGLGADGTTPDTGYPDIAGSGVLLYGGTGIHVGSLVAQSTVYAGDPVASLNGVEQSHGTGGIAIDSLSTGGAVTLSADRSAVTATIVAAGPITATGTDVTLTAPTASLQIAQATATTGDVTIAAGGDLTASGAIVSTLGDVDLSAGGLVDVASLSAGDTAVVSAGTTLHAGSITVGTDTASVDNDGTGVFGSLALIAGDAITVDTPFAVTGSIGLVSYRAGIDLDSLSAGANGSVAVLSGGDIRLGTVNAPDLLYVGGPAALASLGNEPDVPEILAVLRSAGAVASGGAVTIGQATTGSATIAAGTTLTLGGPLTASTGAATLAAGGNLVAQDVTASGAVSATSSGGAVTLGAVTAGQPTIAGGIRLSALQAVTAGPLVASGSVAAASSAAGLALQDVTSTGGGVTASAGGGDIALGTVRAAGSITIMGTGRITAGDLTAGTGPLLPGETGGGGGLDPATGGIAAGFDATTIAACDDCATDSVTLPFTINYFGQTYSTTYVSNNGYLTFNEGQGTYTPSGLGTGYGGLPIIAAFFADVDTRGTGSVLTAYGAGTFAGRQAFGATWNGVGYYSGHTDKLDNFQIVLTNRSDTGAGNFDIYYNYTNIGWETGDASGGEGGFGGTAAAVGYNAGTGNQTGTFYQLAGSLIPGSFVNGGTAPLISTTNDGIAGQLLFQVRNGQVSTGVAAEPPSIHVSNLSGSGTADIQLGNLSAEGAEVHGTGRVTVGTVNVGDRGSGVTATGQAFATVLDAGLGLQAGDVTSTGLIALGSRAGDLSAGTIAGGASVMVLADGSVALGPVTTGTTAADTLYLGGAATGGLAGFDFTTLLSGKSFDPATLATATPAAAGGTITVAGPISTGTLRAAATGAITLAGTTATGGVLVNGGAGITAGALSAGGTVTLDAVGTLDLASVDGTAITLGSSDIAIASGATIGSTRTTSLGFVNTGAGRTAIGDDTGATAGDYMLSAAELASAHATTISVGPQPTEGNVADTLLGTLTLRGGAQQGGNLSGTNAGFTVASQGAIDIVGAAHFTGLTGDETVTLRSTGGDITGPLPAGSVVLDDGNGALAGTLALDAGTILFATADAVRAVSAATTPAAIDAALGDPGTLANPAGYLRADTVSLRFSKALYTQNSGATSALDDRAGVTAGGGGIALMPTTTEAAQPANLVLNARIVRDGVTLTGSQVFNALALRSRTYASGATVNSCLLDGSNCGQPSLAITALVESIQPVQDVVAQVQLASALGNATAYSFTTPALISTIDLSLPVLVPQIDEAVTSAGNDAFWVNIGVGRELAPMGGKPTDAPKP